MEANKVENYIQKVIANMPKGWLETTTHRLDIYNEALAKTEFTEQFEKLYQVKDYSAASLAKLPTAYDYIRLGHPLSCVLEWALAATNGIKAKNVISFSSQTTPILAILRENLLENRATQIYHIGQLPGSFNAEVIQKVYGYHFDIKQVESADEIIKDAASTVLISTQNEIEALNLNDNVDFYINLYPAHGSVLVVNGEQNESYISEIQHVRRRETISMTPINCFAALELLANGNTSVMPSNTAANKASVVASIKEITQTNVEPLVGSSGLSVQYAIMMGLIDYAIENHPSKAIKFIVPTNCYGGTNDQARRVAACLPNVEIVDLKVDGDNDMVQSIETVLAQLAKEDAVPFIIAEIPTNPRVEVPELLDLKAALTKERKTDSGAIAIDPVFILDQTFCPNVHFLGEGEMLSTMRAISYASGSKFPSGGKCTAGYCVGNDKTQAILEKIHFHLQVCDNEATALQYEYLAEQLPSMNQRIADAYTNTREFVNFIQETLPEAKINFVSEELAKEGFTPSVFSLDLPTKGNTAEEKETYKRALNHKLISMMITQIPDESKYCVSYGQLKGCYWTIPATSTQGTTKEGDKDYIARVALSGNMDLDQHKSVFKAFVESI